MNIAGAFFDGGGDDGVDGTDDRRFAGHIAELFQISFAVFVAELVAGVLPSGRFAVVFIDGFEQFVFRGENGLDLHAGEATDGGDGFKVERIGHG